MRNQHVKFQSMGSTRKKPPTGFDEPNEDDDQEEVFEQ